MTNPFDRRFLVVTGKGGVGKTTTAIALAHAAANRGQRVCVVEMGGMHTIGGLFGFDERAYGPRSIGHGIDLMQLTPHECVDDFGQRKLHVGRLGSVVFRSRPVRAFLDAVPGLSDLVQLGKCENLLNEPLARDVRYDLMILDAPATGHGLSLLAAARAMAEMTRVGPFFDLANIIEAFLSDPAQAGVVVTTLPEELPAHECVELLEDLRSEPGLVTAVVVNRVRPATLPPLAAWPRVRNALTARPQTAALASLADPAVVQQADQERVLAELRGAVHRLLPEVPVATLPARPVPSLGPAELAGLASFLEVP